MNRPPDTAEEILRLMTREVANVSLTMAKTTCATASDIANSNVWFTPVVMVLAIRDHQPQASALIFDHGVPPAGLVEILRQTLEKLEADGADLIDPEDTLQ